MITSTLTRKLVLGIGIPAALASGAIAAAASSNGPSQASDRATTTVTQTAPGTTKVVSMREPGEDVRGNADEPEHQGAAHDDNGDHHPGHSGPGGGDDSNSGPDDGHDD